MLTTPRWFVLATLTTLGGCTTLGGSTGGSAGGGAGSCREPKTIDSAMAGYVLSIGRDGEHEPFTTRPDGTLAIAENPGAGAYLARLAATPTAGNSLFQPILDGIRRFPRDAQGRIPVLLFVHGGLNSSAGALGRAQMLYKKIRNDNLQPHYPVFVNWRSGPFATYGAHLGRIRQGEISGSAKLTSPVYLLTDIANAIVNTPKSWLVTSEHMFETTGLRDDRYLEQFRQGTDGVWFTGNQNAYARLGRSVLWLATSPAKVVTTPFTYTMAKPAWDIMLRRTNTPFYTPPDLLNVNHQTAIGVRHGNGALYRFLLDLAALNADLRSRPGDPGIAVTLVGHSMGAIIVNRILTLDVDLPIHNVVHMASADSTSNLFARVVPYLQTAAPHVRFYSLSLHPENEDREASALGLTPSGSLLVWIDSMYTTPETVLDRRSGRWENMDRALPLVPSSARSKMRFKIFGLNDDGRKRDADCLFSEPQRHGDFDNLRFWRESTWWGGPTP
ncbi:MAG: hypothetical protein QNJ91_02165 [Gammaproteobacteria bacterium]|nr:hypothetical protein [Gammaproteobacteria bacterium]